MGFTLKVEISLSKDTRRFLYEVLSTTNLNEKLDAMEKLLNRVLVLEGNIMANLDEAIVAIEEANTVLDSLLAYDAALKEEFKKAGVDQAKIDQVFNGVQAFKTKIADALVRNTPNAAA